MSFRVASSLNEVVIETHRRRHLAYLMADQGALVGNPEAVPNLPKQHLSRLAKVFLGLVGYFFRYLFGCVFDSPYKKKKPKNLIK